MSILTSENSQHLTVTEKEKNMKTHFKPVAIIGYGCIFPPDGTNTERFWENVLSGANGITEVSKSYWKESLYFNNDKHVEDKTYCKKGAIMSEYSFPLQVAISFGLDEKEVLECNKTQKMTLDTILQAMVKAGLTVKDLVEANFFIGNMLGDSDVPNQMLVNRINEIEAYIETSEEFRGLDKEQQKIIQVALEEEIKEKFEQLKNDNLIPSSLLFKIKKILGVTGHGCIVDGACSGSGLVIDEAVKSIQYGQKDMCITTAVLGNMVVTGNIGFAKIGGLSETSSFPLDEKADGLIPGEGAGTIILKDLKKAIEDNNHIYGVIRGTGVASDGKGQSIYAPSSKGQLKAMNKSIDISGLTVDDVDYIETHATGTKVGDKVEIDTIKAFFERGKLKDRKIPIGSLKSQIGHAFSAAGMANMMKILEAMNHEVLPPTYNFERVPDKVDMGNLYVNTSKQNWLRREAHTPRRAMLNAFGFGGINANVLIEEYLPDYHMELIKNVYQQKLTDEFSIVGLGCIDHRGNNYGQWKDNYSRGKIALPESIAADYPTEAQALYEDKKGYFIKNFKFPFIKYHIPPKILNEIDKSQQYALIASGEAIEDYGKDKIDGTKTGVFVGNMMGLATALKADFRVRHMEYIDILQNSGKKADVTPDQIESISTHITERVRSYLAKIEEDALPGYMDNIIAGRISNFYDFSSTNAIYDKDMVSFDAALYQAMLSLKSGENDLAVVGGVSGNMLPEIFDSLDYMKKDLVRQYNNEEIKRFIPAEGATFFVLKRSSDVTSEDHVYAKLHGMRHLGNVKKITNLKSNLPFYFGAQDAFELLEEVTNLNINNAFTKVTEICNGSLCGEGYVYEIGGSKVEFADMNSNKEDDTNKSKEKTRFFIAYFVSDKEQMILDGEVDKQEYERSKSHYKMIVTYQSKEDLKRKIELCKKNIGRR